MTVLSYQSPTTPDGVPRYRFYPPGAILLATLLGSPTAGSILIALNYRRLAAKSNAWQAVGAGILVTVGLLFASQFAGEAIGRGLLIGSLIATYHTAKHLQGHAFAQHIEKGGRRASYWSAAGIGLACLVVIFGAVLLIADLPDLIGPSTLHGTIGIYKKGPGVAPRAFNVSATEKIYYVGDATEAMAKTTADTLRAQGLFNGASPKTLVLKEVAGAVTLSFMASADAVEPKYMEAFRALGETVRQALGKPSLTIRLVDSDMKELKRLTIP